MIACNDESNFVNAKKFDPQRWMDAEDKPSKLDLGSSLVVPFGVGKRTCPGKRFVELELIALLSKVNLIIDANGRNNTKLNKKNRFSFFRHSTLPTVEN